MSTSVEALMKSDKVLSANPNFKGLHEKYSAVASDATIALVKEGLEKKNHACTVVADKEEALKRVIQLIPEGVSVYYTSSDTLTSIGFISYLNESDKYDNLRTKVFAENDAAKRRELRRLACGADCAVASVDAITENGEFLVADATGTRVGVFNAAREIIVVVGSNKLVKDLEAARERLYTYCFALESARVRPGTSSVSNELYVNTNAPTPTKYHFVIVKESLGY